MRFALSLLSCLAFALPAAASQTAPGIGDVLGAAVRERMGQAVEVRVTDPQSSVRDASGLRAAPEPGARTGRSVRFTLWSGLRRVGTAEAHIEVFAPQVVAANAIARGGTIGAEDVLEIKAPLSGALLRRLPAPDQVIGASARRDIAAGEVLTSAVVQVPLAVRSGDRVTVTVRVGAAEVEGPGRASGSGYVGDLIRVSAWGGRELRRARITAPGAVEIVP